MSHNVSQIEEDNVNQTQIQHQDSDLEEEDEYISEHSSLDQDQDE